jgi:transcriptional regulator with XRE-family HTH domain
MNTKIKHMINQFGGRKHLAEKLGVSLATVTVWKNSKRVPKFQQRTAEQLAEMGLDKDFWTKPFCKEFRVFAGEDVSLDELVQERGFDKDLHISFYELKDGKTLYYQVLAG